MVGIGRTDLSRAALAALDLARRYRRAYPRGGFEGREPAELQVIVSLYRASVRTVGELAGELELARTTVSHAVARLSEAELVRSRPDPDEPRAVLLALTRRGRSLGQRFLNHVSQLEH